MGEESSREKNQRYIGAGGVDSAQSSQRRGRPERQLQLLLHGKSQKIFDAPPGLGNWKPAGSSENPTLTLQDLINAIIKNGDQNEF